MESELQLEQIYYYWLPYVRRVGIRRLVPIEETARIKTLRRDGPGRPARREGWGGVAAWKRGGVAAAAAAVAVAVAGIEVRPPGRIV